jgi:hypothetical protein
VGAAAAGVAGALACAGAAEAGWAVAAAELMAPGPGVCPEEAFWPPAFWPEASPPVAEP